MADGLQQGAPSVEGVPREGELIGAKYRVEGVLGVGGMGAVVAARHLDLGHRVAVKVMLPSVARQLVSSQRFLREARAVASIKSEHVARVFDVGHRDDGTPFIVMELLTGQGLDELARERGPLPIVEAVEYVLQACEALAEAHAMGIVHRDLKPSNLFLLPRSGAPPLVKVLDFGISKTTRLCMADDDASLTNSNSMLGSPQYMSPEQIRNSKNVDARADIWALGAILYKLLTTRTPFEADTAGAFLAMIVADPPTPLRRFRPDAPAALEAVAQRCLEKDVARRFPTVGHLARALQPFAPDSAVRSIERIVVALGGDAALGIASATDDPTLLEHSEPVHPATTAPPVPSAVPPLRGRLTRAAIVPAMCAVAGIALTLVLRRTSPAPAETALPKVPPAHAIPSALDSAPSPEMHPVPAPAPTVELHVLVEPPHATIELDGAPLEGGIARVPRSSNVHRILARAPGYGSASREIDAQRDAEIALTLPREPSVPKRARTATSTASPYPTSDRVPRPRFKGPMETDL